MRFENTRNTKHDQRAGLKRKISVQIGPGSNHMGKKVLADGKWLFAICVTLLFVMTRYYFPDFFDNERYYSLNPMKMLDPTILRYDHLMADYYYYFIYFDVITLPLYKIFGELYAVFILRIIVWSFQLWALSRLMRTIGMKWWGFVLLIAIWINVEQTLVAGDWIFRSANSKPVCYGFIFLSLSYLLQGDNRGAGVSCGFATMMHVIGGLWANLAISLSILLNSKKDSRYGDLLGFGVPAALLSMIGVIPALYGEIGSQQALASTQSFGDVAKLYVLLACPFHLDSLYFMSGLEYLKVGVFFLSSLVMMKYLVAGDRGKLIGSFILFLCLFFLTGMAARYFNLFSYLRYYPFRLADSFVPLMFWAGIIIIYQTYVESKTWRRILLVLIVPVTIGISNFIIELCEPRPVYGLNVKSLSTALINTEPRTTVYNAREKVRAWHRFLYDDKKNDLEDMHDWIRKNTPKDSVFLPLPWDLSFAIKAQRSAFISLWWPNDAGILEWIARVQLVNRGPLRSVGHDIFKEVRRNYPLLTDGELTAIKNKHRNIDYFLTNSATEYSFPLAHRNVSYRLYDLRGMQAMNGVSRK